MTGHCDYCGESLDRAGPPWCPKRWPGDDAYEATRETLSCRAPTVLKPPQNIACGVYEPDVKNETQVRGITIGAEREESETR